MHLFTNQKQNKRHRKQNYGYQTGRKREIYQEFGINIYIPLYKTDKQGPMYTPGNGNSTQYFVITYIVKNL